MEWNCLNLHARKRTWTFSNLLCSQVTSSAGVLSKMQIRWQMLLSNYCLGFKLQVFASKRRKTYEKRKCFLCQSPDSILRCTEKLIIVPKTSRASWKGLLMEIALVGTCGGTEWQHNSLMDRRRANLLYFHILSL